MARNNSSTLRGTSVAQLTSSLNPKDNLGGCCEIRHYRFDSSSRAIESPDNNNRMAPFISASSTFSQTKTFILSSSIALSLALGGLFNLLMLDGRLEGQLLIKKPI